MENRLTAADANRRFSEVLRGVKAGQSYVVTSQGRVVARIAPAEDSEIRAASAKAALLARLRLEKTIKIGRWSRQGLYQDGR